MAFSLKEKVAANYANGEFPALHDDQHNEPLELDLTRPALQQPVLELDLNQDMPMASAKQTCSTCDNFSNGICYIGWKPTKTGCEKFIQWKQTTASEVFGEISPTLPRHEEVEIQPFEIKPKSVRTDTSTLPSVAEFSAVKLAEELGYTEILTVGALEDGIRFYQQRTAEACLELGKRLLLLKELAGHGEFTDRVRLLGFSKASASRFMSMTRKFTKSSSLEHLIPKIGSQQKLIELLILDDDDIEELAKGNEASGVTLDEIECMTATELRKALRKYKDGDIPEEVRKPLFDEIDSLTKQIENHQKHYGQLEAKLEVTEDKLKKIVEQKKLGNDLMDLETCKIREEAFAFEYGARLHIDYLRQLLNHAITTSAPNDDEQLLRVNAVAIATASIYAQVDDLFCYCQDVLGINNMPPILNSKHVLTPEEKERVEHAKEIIEHKFNVDASSRENKRFEENRKSAGRPAGSPNKLKQY